MNPAIKPYDYRVTEHFWLREFFTNPEDKWVVGYYLQNKQRFDLAISKQCRLVLEPARKRFGGKSLVITSGGRSPIHNANSGGAKSSRHLTFEATDGHIEGVSLEDYHAYLKTNPYVGGLAIGPGFIHEDIRPRVFGQIVTWRY